MEKEIPRDDLMGCDAQLLGVRRPGAALVNRQTGVALLASIHI